MLSKCSNSCKNESLEFVPLWSLIFIVPVSASIFRAYSDYDFQMVRADIIGEDNQRISTTLKTLLIGQASLQISIFQYLCEKC